MKEIRFRWLEKIDTTASSPPIMAVLIAPVPP
jgi:hypothetical protein